MPVLTIRGRGHNAAWTTLSLNTDFSVTTTGATTVVKRAVDAAFDLDDINVGQQVRVYGTLSGTAMTATLVRLQPTRVFGFANAAASGGQIEIDLQRIGLRLPGLFTFPSAVPATFNVEIGALGTGGAIASTAMEFRGYFPPVTDVSRDFNADSVINRDNALSGLRIRMPWPGLGSGITTSTSSGITFDVSSAVVAVVDKGFVGATALATSPAPKVVQTVLGFRLYALRVGTSVSLYLTFADFAAAIAAQKTAGAKLYWFGALGSHNPGTNEFTTALAVAVMTP
jgi:hypothetical protein